MTNKLTVDQLDSFIEAVNDFLHDLSLDAIIENEGYPIEYTPREFAGMLDKFNSIVGIDSNITEMFPKTILDIEKEINYQNMEEFIELEEVDSYDDLSERKYCYTTTIFKFKPTGEHYAVTVQYTADGENQLDFTWNGKVTKQEKVTYEWK